MSTRRSLWLDLKPESSSPGGGASTNSGLRATSWVEGIVTEVLDYGWLEVGIPADQPTTRASGPSDGLITQVGARVRVLLDPQGRILQINAPQKVDPDREVVPTGSAGLSISSAVADAAKAASASAEVRERAEAAAAAASQASTVARSALEAAEKSTDSRFSATAPTDPKEGTIWYALDDQGRITGVKVYAGGAWVPRPLVADQVLVPGSVGNTLIADGAVTSPKIQATQELWARLSVFEESIVDKLIAQNATIPGSLIAGTLRGNSLHGAAIYGGEFNMRDAMGTSQASAIPTNSTLNWTLQGTGAMSANGGALYYRPGAGSKNSGLRYTPPSGRVGPDTGEGSLITVVSKITPAEDVFLQVGYTEDGKKKTTSSRSLSVLVPDGSTVDYAELISPGGKGFRVDHMRVDWAPILTSGLRLYRDQGGLSHLDISSTAGKAEFTSHGLKYTPSGKSPASLSWANLIDPPMASVIWPANVGPNAASGVDGILSASLGSATVRGGAYIESGYLRAPVSGWYQVSVSCGFLWESSKEGWAVACGLRRSSRNRVDWEGDPACTLPFAPRVTIRPAANDLIHLDKGEGITLAHWQNTGSWRPNAGKSRLGMYLVDAD